MTTTNVLGSTELDRFAGESEPDRGHLKVRAGAAADGSPIWTQPAQNASAAGTVGVSRVATVALATDLERRILDCLHRPIARGESHVTGNANREVELRALFVELDALQSFHLKRRLELARADDPLCIAFRRLATDRRQRLLNVLADARRREYQSR